MKNQRYGIRTLSTANAKPWKFKFSAPSTEQYEAYFYLKLKAILGVSQVGQKAINYVSSSIQVLFNFDFNRIWFELE